MNFPDLTLIKIPLLFTLKHLTHKGCLSSQPFEILQKWHGRLDFLDLEISGFETREDATYWIRARLLSMSGDNLREVTFEECGLIPSEDGERHSQTFKLSALPTSKFRELIYQRNLGRLQRRALEAAKRWRSEYLPQAPDRDLLEALDDLVHWERSPRA